MNIIYVSAASELSKNHTSLSVRPGQVDPSLDVKNFDYVVVELPLGLREDSGVRCAVDTIDKFNSARSEDGQPAVACLTKRNDDVVADMRAAGVIVIPFEESLLRSTRVKTIVDFTALIGSLPKRAGGVKKRVKYSVRTELKRAARISTPYVRQRRPLPHKKTGPRRELSTVWIDDVPYTMFTRGTILLKVLSDARQAGRPPLTAQQLYDEVASLAGKEPTGNLSPTPDMIDHRVAAMLFEVRKGLGDIKRQLATYYSKPVQGNPLATYEWLGNPVVTESERIELKPGASERLASRAAECRGSSAPVAG